MSQSLRTPAQFQRMQAIAQSWVRGDKGSTHWDGCETSHVDCALAEAADYLREASERLRVNADLLSALKAMLKFNEELCADVNVSKHYPSADFARKVIAKAEGHD